MLIVGLGNFGKTYINTYHNIGFMTTDLLATKLSVKLSRKGCEAKFYTGEIEGKQIIVAQPLTYMNLSGLAISKLARKFNVSNEDICVIYDDLDLPVGQVRFRKNGSGGTHNGMKNVVDHMGENIKRIRIGIGKNDKIPTSDYVLSKIKGENKDKIKAAITTVVNALCQFISNQNVQVLEELNK